ncbi:MAG: Reverse transcriptase [Planctomycetia bacterium]
MITLEDLGLAYRKAKVDLYYSTLAPIGLMADYEQDLYENLSALRAKINGDDESWAILPAFIGSWTVATKSVDMQDLKRPRQEFCSGIIFSSPAEEWENACKLLNTLDEPVKPSAEFRVMARCTMDFHVLSTLWMLEVGHLYDEKLTDCAFGNRLRRKESGKNDINKISIGTFKPYLKPFRDWRDKGIKAMRSALDAGRKIVALTADVSSFYHELNCGFMLAPSFMKDVLGLDLNEKQAKINRLFIHAVHAWASATPLKKGLPVGLPASAVVANVALVELDRIIEREVVPLYYGRYVDDVLLVMENGTDFRSTREVWDWLLSRSAGRLGWADDKHRTRICFQPDYLKHGDGKSQIQFANDKNKAFVLAGDAGKTLVDTIAHQIHERASEWRAMPRLPRSTSHAGTDLLAATQSDGEAADSLRKADALTMRRAGFAIKLRDFEAYERDLLPEAWQSHRRAFFQAFTQYVLVLPQFFDLAVYLPRVVRLATACEDFSDLYGIIAALETLCMQVQTQCCISIKACAAEDTIPDEIMSRWQTQLFDTVYECIAAAFPPRLTKSGKQAWDAHMANYRPQIDVENSRFELLSEKRLKAQQARLFSFDLAHLPFRFIGLPTEMIAQRGIPPRKSVLRHFEAAELLPKPVICGNQTLAGWIKFKVLPGGLLFATRPFSLPELFLLNRDAYAESGQAAMRDVVLAVRGFSPGKKAPRFDRHGVLQIPDGQKSDKYNIAVSSWKTHISSWTASVTRDPDPDGDRYSRLCRLLDGVISQPSACRYLILPELALPAHWFVRIARKLQGRGISLITGIQYLHAGKSRVRNQVWAALSHHGLGFPSLMIYRQDKQCPALHEERELQQLAGLKMMPDKSWRTPPIIQHGEFRFAFLVCSELTNIKHRADLRGKVDALFVPEWNRDTETFNALVESAALDMHAYIIQCNDRQYGDSRIRAPFKESWQRDVLRVKGGIIDYCVIGEVDVQSLRQFQSSHRSPESPFKPVPDGFNESMDHHRKVLPRGKSE